MVEFIDTGLAERSIPPDIRLLIDEAESHICAGRHHLAANLYEKLLTRMPDSSNLHHTLGLVYLELNHIDTAIFHIKQSIKIKPNIAKPYRSLGEVYATSGRFEAACSAYEKAWLLNKNDPDVLINLGNTLYRLNKFSKAIDVYHQALGLSPGNVKALNNIGKTYQDMGDINQAIEYYNRCVEIDPSYAEARFNRSVAFLTIGDYQKGWPEYEWRFRRRLADKVYPHKIETPRWDGQSYLGQRLFVHCEQGMGDIVQFVRYLPLVKQLGGTLILEVHPPLLTLFQRMPWIDEVVGFNPRHAPCVHHHQHIPLLSLPSLFQTSLNDLSCHKAYLYSDKVHTAIWQKQFTKDKLNIGLVWSGSDTNPKRNYSFNLCQSWLKIPGLRFFSLQKGPAENQIQQYPDTGPVTALGHQLHDFRDTAAVIANLDLIISVDTVVGHLAGAMGKPVWVLLPYNADWRWPPHRKDTPWYPTAKIFRQSHLDDWPPVIAQVGHELKKWRSKVIEPESINRPPWQDNHKTKKNHDTPPIRAYHGLRMRPSKRNTNSLGIKSNQIKRPHHLGSQRAGECKIKNVLLASPIFGGSFEVIRYLHNGFLNAGFNASFLDNTDYYAALQQINQLKHDNIKQDQLTERLIATIDQRLMVRIEQDMPDLVMFVAQSPIHNETVAKLRAKGIATAYWFVEDYRFRPYWEQIAPVFDFFFTIQRDEELKRNFVSMGHPNWHYLPLACEPSVHRPLRPDRHDLKPYQCQIGFMGSPYLNRLNVFEELVNWDLGIWGEGWNGVEVSPRLTACIKDGNKKISIQETVRIYCGADIIVNLHSSPFDKGINAEGDFVNPRTLEIAGCAGFQLSDYRKELPGIFSPGEEIILFETVEELKDLIRFWLPRHEERRKISLKAQQKAYAKHTYQHRAEAIIRLVEGKITDSSDYIQ